MTARTRYDRSALPKEIFDKNGAHELVLISCAGRYIRGYGYETNVVIFAERVV